MMPDSAPISLGKISPPPKVREGMKEWGVRMFTYRATAVSLQVDTQLGPRQLKVTFRNTRKRIHTYCFKFFYLLIKKRIKTSLQTHICIYKVIPVVKGRQALKRTAGQLFIKKKWVPFASELVGSDYFTWVKNYWKIESASLIINSRKAIS